MNVQCPKCQENFELDAELHKEGDSVECSSCRIELFVVKKEKKLGVAESFEEDKDSQGWED